MNAIRDKAKTAYLILMIVFLCTAIGLAIWLGITYKKTDDFDNQLEARYQQAYYELLGQTNDMEVKMAKLAVSTSPITQQQLLYEVWKGAEVSANCLSALSSSDNSVTEATEFINKMGDYCYFLATKVASGKSLTTDDLTSLDKIQDILTLLGQELNKIKTSISEGYLFIENIGGENDMLGNLFVALSGNSVEYPQLIYDGPFSDSLILTDIKYDLGENDITQEDGEVIIRDLFKNETIEEVEFAGEGASDIPTMDYELTMGGYPESVRVQLTKRGGKVISINTFYEIDEAKLNEAECGELAVQYVAKLGYGNLQVVWSANTSGIIYVNLAPTQGGAILYPDLIKVKVSADNGRIVGLDAANYVFNHCERELPDSLITEQEARANLSTALSDIDGGRLALIPKGTEEVLCYEYSANSNGSYMIYMNAVTGEEEDVMFIIDAENGKLVM